MGFIQIRRCDLFGGWAGSYLGKRIDGWKLLSGADGLEATFGSGLNEWLSADYESGLNEWLSADFGNGLNGWAVNGFGERIERMGCQRIWGTD